MNDITADLTLLGKQSDYPSTYAPEILEAFPNPAPSSHYLITLACPEFTSLCPITGQPDFAQININYLPDQWLVESKSLKIYLFSFRNHGAFHESCVNMIADDLVQLLAPKYLEVAGYFSPRGGIAIQPFAVYAKPNAGYDDFARERQLQQMAAQNTRGRA